MGSPSHVQLLATVRRNLLIKRRDAAHTIQQLLLPVYIIFLLVVVKLGTPTIYLPGTNWMNKVDGMCQPVEQPLDNVCRETDLRPSHETLLAFVPQSNKGVRTLMHQVLKEFGDWYSPSVQQLSLRGFDTEEGLISFYNTHPETVYAGVIFDGADGVEDLPSDLNFRIRMNGSYVPSTSKFQGEKNSCHDYTRSCLSDKYLTSGFLALQTTISQVTRSLALPTQCGPSKQMKSFFVQKQPLNEFSQSFADTLFQLFTAMYLVWAFAPQLQTTLSHIVEEKETLIKDYMLLMGLRESIYWLSWLIAYALMSAITVCVLVWTAKVSTLFEFSSVGALFFLIYTYSLSLTTMAFALSTVFSKAQTAGALSGLLMLFSSLAVIPIELLHLPAPVCAFLALFSPAGFAMAINVVVRAEGRGRGVHMLGRRNFWSRAAGLDFSDHNNPLSPGELVVIFLFDAVLYAIAAWYLDNTWPHPERGAKRPWGFCFSSKYWFPSTATSGYTLAQDRKVKHHVSQQDLDDASLEMSSVPDTALEVDIPETSEESNPDIESVSFDLQSRAGIVIKELRQVSRRRKGWWQWLAGLGCRFRRDQNPVTKYEVVKGLNITLYEGQCFAIVGHSGSGKSAVVNMLSGLSRATSGEAYIYGLPVTDAGEELHSLIGVCPQQNVAVSSLTIREQLSYFATIKGQCVHFGRDGLEERQHSKETVEQMVENLVADLGLLSDADKEAKTLSKPASRKLSLAIALIGDPQVVIMDQPTRSLDLVSRKQFWDMMHKRQKGRVILFTTDSMEEADVVADRKAVLSHGVLKCCGSSFFLRNRFGLSYLLHVTKGERFNSLAVWDLIIKHVPTAVLLPAPRGQAHATYKLPLGIPARTSALLVELTERAVELGLDEGALEATTLEEIFMQFQDEDEDAAGVVAVRDTQEWNNFPGLMDEADDEALLIGGERSADVDSLKRRHTSLFPQISAILRARLTFPRRNWQLYCTMFLVPLVLILASLIAQVFISSNPSPQPLLLQDLRLAKTLPIFYSVSNLSAGPQALSMLDSFGPDHIRLYPRDPDPWNTADLTDMPNNDETHIVGISFDKLDFENCTLQYTIACHPLQIHEVPTLASMMENLFLQILRNNYSGNNTLYAPSSLHANSHPLPFEVNSNSFAYVVVLMTAMGLMFIPSIFCAQVVIEKENGILSLLRVSGMQSAAYWLATLLSDLMLFFGVVSLVLGMGLSFGQPPFIKEAAPAAFFLFLVTIPATVVQGYSLSFCFKSAVAAAPFLALFFLLGAVLPYFMIFDAAGDLKYPSWHILLTVIDPPYALTSGLHFIVRTIDNVMSSNGAAPSEMPSPTYFFEWKNYVVLSILGSVAGMIIHVIFLWRLETHSLDPATRTGADGAGNQVIPREGSSNNSDIDQEKERVQSSASRWEGMRIVDGPDEPEVDSILCYNLGKSYGSSEGICGVGAARGTCVLRDLWLAVGSGEIVVLVGGHKAGKSTLLHCLAGIEPVSVGDAIVLGTSVRYGYLHKLSRIGFCPQYEAMYMSMTVREHLQLHAALKGVAQPQSLAVETALQAMQLSDVADTRIENCKAGTKRMLSLAVALLGSPPVLMLDEPSSGMDFARRTRAWKRISAQSTHCATLICTQSFEEASVLGTRVGIIVEGQLKCLAPPLELKRRHGSDYTLLVLADSDKMPEICKFINTLFSGDTSEGVGIVAEAVEDGVGLDRQKQFQVPVRSLSQLARLLQELEAKREALKIKDYVVSQPTLQQVFYRLTQSPTS
ncbi:hypothetical protein KC19_4G270200 [Ceratodon purpureus]|uniref:ABC transporter domain-containing protein n=1 Tax=Ceratodon purpureus TaxID=3225 RepID=A0A8T0IFK5_CERPU|nr:hypothetical protein KC19_4G270200 [Ceratodon purpureus]